VVAKRKIHSPTGNQTPVIQQIASHCTTGAILAHNNQECNILNSHEIIKKWVASTFAEFVKNLTSQKWCALAAAKAEAILQKYSNVFNDKDKIQFKAEYNGRRVGGEKFAYYRETVFLHPFYLREYIGQSCFE
jgi:hypothetical protein